MNRRGFILGLGALFAVDKIPKFVTANISNPLKNSYYLHTRLIKPKILASELVGIQPMKAPTGQIFHMKSDFRKVMS